MLLGSLLGAIVTKVKIGWPEALTVIMLAACLPLAWNIPLHHDVIWQLWVGRQIYLGGELYSGIVELNPPLWFWAAIPMAWVSELTGLRDRSVLILFFFAATGISILLSGLVWRGRPPQERAALYAAILSASLLSSLANFGQREHFTFLVCVPYALLVARRAEGGAVPAGLALAIGMFAAPGIALKHYFVLVPVALEAWYVISARTRWKPFRPEFLMLAGGALLYGVAVAAMTPDFLKIIVPMVELAYSGYDQPLADLIYKPAVAIGLLVILGFAVNPKAPSKPAQAALVVTAAFFLAYLVQRKGWTYHAFPVAGMLLLAVATEFPRVLDKGASMLRRAAAILFFSAALLASLLNAFGDGTYRNAYRKSAEQAMADLGEGDAVLSLSAHASSAWPMAGERDLKWSSRHYIFWMLPAFEEEEARPGMKSMQMRAFASQVRRDTARDIACMPPARILIDKSKSKSLSPGFDILGFFRKEPAFETVFRNYRRGAENDRFVIFDQAGPIAADRRGCRRIY